jgi:hypothetical protein
MYTYRYGRCDPVAIFRYGDTNFDKNRQTIVRMVRARAAHCGALRVLATVGYCEYSHLRGTMSTPSAVLRTPSALDAAAACSTPTPRRAHEP